MVVTETAEKSFESQHCLQVSAQHQLDLSLHIKRFALIVGFILDKILVFLTSANLVLTEKLCSIAGIASTAREPSTTPAATPLPEVFCVAPEFWEEGEIDCGQSRPDGTYDLRHRCKYMCGEGNLTLH